VLIVDESDSHLEGRKDRATIVSSKIIIKNRDDAIKLSAFIKKLLQNAQSYSMQAC